MEPTLADVPDWMRGMRQSHAQTAAAGWRAQAEGFRTELMVLPAGDPERSKLEASANLAQAMADWWDSVLVPAE